MLRVLILLSSSVAITGCATLPPEPASQDHEPYVLPNGTLAYPIPELNDDATFRARARQKCGGGIILYPPEENSAGVRLYQCNR
jgi:hypothetical protein